jgi:hypothetical protein
MTSHAAPSKIEACPVPQRINSGEQIKYRPRTDRNRFVIMLSITLAFVGALLKASIMPLFPYGEFVAFLGIVATSSYGIKSYRDYKENASAETLGTYQGGGKVDPFMG